MSISEQHFREVLQAKLDDLCQKNSNYSLRSFAKKLEVSPSTLSRVLSGQKPLSIKLAEKIGAKLLKSKDERNLFVDSAVRDYRSKMGAGGTVAADEDKPVDLLSMDQMSPALASLAFTILELTFTEGYEDNVKYLTQRTGRSAEEVERAVSVLVASGLLEQKDGSLRKSLKRIHLRSEESSNTQLNSFYEELFRFAAEKTKNHDRRSGAIVSMTLPSDPAKLDIARALMEEFSWKLCQILTSEEKTEVYHLGMFLEPATITRSNKP